MVRDREIINMAEQLEAQAKGMLNTAALLRQRVLAGGQPAPARKGRGVDPQIAALATANYEKKKARKQSKLR